MAATVLRTKRTEPLVPLRTRRRSDFRETPQTGRNAAPSFAGRSEKLDQNFKGFKVRTKQWRFSPFPSGKEKEFAGAARTRARARARSGSPGRRSAISCPAFPAFCPRPWPTGWGWGWGRQDHAPTDPLTGTSPFNRNPHSTSAGSVSLVNNAPLKA